MYEISLSLSLFLFVLFVYAGQLDEIFFFLRILFLYYVEGLKIFTEHLYGYFFFLDFMPL